MNLFGGTKKTTQKMSKNDDPIGDSWEARISSVRMSSKNLVGENAEKCKKVSKNQCTNGGNKYTLFARESSRSKAKKEKSSEEFCF